MIKTYEEMNKEIKTLLRISGNPSQLYAAQRIEELENQWELLKVELEQLEEFYDRCNSENEIHVIHDIQSLIAKMETGEYYGKKL